jgi:nucleoside-diphosphate kinase
MRERTLIIAKPDCLTKGLCGKVLTRFEEAGFRICGCKMLQLHSKILQDHYAHIANKPFYEEVEEFMSSTPVIVLVLEGDDAIAKARNMLGVTDSRKAAPGTIRATLGVDQMINVAHASDTQETAEREIQRFFSQNELFTY